MDTFSKVIKKSRKDHHCWGCNETIPKGSKYKKVVTFDGTAIDANYCEWCEEVFKRLEYHETEDGVDCGDFKQFFIDCPERFESIEIEPLFTLKEQ